jgi:PAS domain S-box-containing protein
MKPTRYFPAEENNMICSTLQGCFSVLGLCLCLLFPAWAQGANLALTPQEQAWLAEHPKIVLGICDQFQPDLIIEPDGAYSGIAGDYLKLLNRQLGERLELYVDSDWSAVTGKAMRGEIDGLMVSGPNPLWDRYFIYSQPYYYAYMHFYIRADAPAISEKADLAGKRVGYLDGMRTVERLLRDVPGIRLFPLKSNEAMAKSLLENQVDVIVNLIDLEWWRRQNSQLGIKLSGFLADSRHPVVSSIRKDWPLFLSIFNKAMNAIPAEEHERIRQRWHGGSQVAPDNPQGLRLSADERAYLDNLVLRRGRADGWMPFNFLDQRGEVVGIGEDYWTLIRDKLGLRERLGEPMLFAEALEKMQQGELDLYIGTTRTEDREAYALFSDAYRQYPIAIATRKSAGFVSNAASLEGKRVAVGRNYSAYHLLKARYPGIEFIQVRHTGEALEQVVAGNAFAAVDILPVLQHQIEQLDLNEVRLAGVTETYFPFQIMLRKEYARLLPLLNRAIAAISAEERMEIEQKWMLREVISTPNYRLVGEILGIALLIIAVMLYWNRRLAREIGLRGQAEKRYRELSARLEKIADRVPGMIYQFHIRSDGGWCFPYASQAIERVFRVSPEEVRGDASQVLALIHPNDARRVTESIHESARSLQAWRIDYRVCYQDGAVRWLRGDAMPEKQADGSILWHGYITDISERKQAEQQLQETSERLHSILASMEDLVFVLDAEGRYLDSYQTPTPHTGLLMPSEQFLGKHYREVMPAPMADLIAQKIAALRENGAQQFEYALALPDGEHWFNASLTARRDGAGGFVGCTVVVRDISARYRMETALRDSEARLRMLSDNLPNSMIYQIDSGEHGQIRRFSYVSASVEKLHGASVAEALRDPEKVYGQVLDADRALLAAQEAQALANLSTLRAEVRCRPPGGEIRWRLFTSAPRRLDNGHLLWDGIETDITERKQAEIELNQARKAADAANRAKSAFIANMSHELRTPLNAVLGFAQILLQSPALSAIQRNQIESIQHGGEYLLMLINDILDLAKIEAERFELFPDTWDTGGFFQELVQMFKLRAEQKGITFEYEQITPLPYALYCDARRLRQIALNLLGNAVKFTERGGVILRTGHATGTLWLEVADSGSGIAPADIEKLFEPFQQVGADRYKSQGTGLGLAISRRLAQAMGGSLQVDSTLGQGSVFRVEIPATDVSSQAETRATPRHRQVITGYRRIRGGGPLRILVVDDLPDNRQIVRQLLEPLGFAVMEAENAQECLEMARNTPSDAILMDLRMPGMDGLQATRALREQGSGSPVIALSASTFAEDHEASRQAGCVAHLSKPLRLAELLDVLARLLPLEWEYATDTEAQAGALETLAPEQAAHFAHLVEMGDMYGLEVFARELAGEYPRFAKNLGELVETFQIEKLRELFRQYEKK